MVILEKPFVSVELKGYLEEEQIPVLKNQMALDVCSDNKCNLMDDESFRKALLEAPRIYTTSENALEWIYNNVKDEEMLAAVNVMKDKVLFRKRLQSVYPQFFFREMAPEELKKTDPSSLPFPLILKPSVGFFSIGVYTIYNEDDWKHAVKEIEEQMDSWKNQFPESVIGSASFILEEYIEGEEYALDAYFDKEGEPVILNIMKHDFSSSTDVSDRLYYTGKEMIEGKLETFTQYLRVLNCLMGAKNFPVHIELRVGENKIVPIECNPMRFAGWCTTDLVRFAFGLNTVEYYLKGKKPDWMELLKGKEGKLYSLIVLDKPRSEKMPASFDYEALKESFQKVLCLRKLDFKSYPAFGFLFTETDSARKEELENIVRSDLTEYITWA